MSGGTYGDNSVIGIDKTTKELIVTFPVLTTPVLDSGIASIPIPDIPGARLTMEPTANGGQTLALRIPLDKVIRGVALLPPSKLPNGDPLPAVADGELPSAAVQFPISRTKVTVYLAPTEVCLYVDSPFDPFVSLTLPIRNQARTKTWGYFSTIPAKSNSVKGGFFVSIKLPDDVARAIDNVL